MATSTMKACYPVCLMLVLFLRNEEVIFAAIASSNYSPSFSPTETYRFWSSSPSGNYTFGFKNVDGSSGDYILAIWHSKDPNQTAIWWAQFGHNPTVTDTATMNRSTSGMLELYSSSPSTTLWSTGNSIANAVQFLDSGNLRLLNTKISSSSDVAWESFGDLRDTVMLVNLTATMMENNQNFLWSRGHGSSYRRGEYHMETKSGSVNIPGSFSSFNFSLYGIDQLHNQYCYVTNVNLSISYGTNQVSVLEKTNLTVFSNPELLKLTLDYDGELRLYEWSLNESTWKKEWQLTSVEPIKCRIGNPCGPFGFCRLNDSDVDGISCSCPNGFHANSSQDRSAGCSRDIPLPACGDQSDKYNITMTEDPNKDYIYSDNLQIIRHIYDKEKCMQLCLDNCKCLAATYFVIGRCYLKGNRTKGYFVNGIVQNSSGTFMMKVAVPISVAEDNRKQVVLIAATVVAVVLFIGILIVIWHRCRRRLRKIYNMIRLPDIYSMIRLPKIDDRSSDAVSRAGPKWFSYKELLKATEGFSHPLNDGAGNGMVCKGWVNCNKGLPGDKTLVAVKLLKSYNISRLNQEEQFRAEIGRIGKFHHINLVKLLGHCVAPVGKEVKHLLVYEYMANGSLDKYISVENNVEMPLPWTTRYAIAVGIARGIAYLHNDCNPPILHCNINPQNVLLDEHFVPKVAGFGSARLFQPQKDHVIVTGVIGHHGYIAPEWLETNMITSKVDVYSFGMVLLELIHGHCTYNHHHAKLSLWASQCILTQTILPGIDTKSKSQELDLDPANLETKSNVSSQLDPDSKQKLNLLKLVVWCLHPSPAHRPTISQVLQIIEDDQSQIMDMEDPPNPTISSIRIRVASENGGKSYTPSYSALSTR